MTFKRHFQELSSFKCILFIEAPYLTVNPFTVDLH